MKILTDFFSYFLVVNDTFFTSFFMQKPSKYPLIVLYSSKNRVNFSKQFGFFRETILKWWRKR